MSSNLEVAVANLQERYRVDEVALIAAVRQVLQTGGITTGEISIAVVDDARMHPLNLQHLDHNYPTDVLSFVLEQTEDHLEGEIIVSADYAAREAERFAWSVQDELRLYVVHGALHMIGYDDQTPQAKREMREQERRHLAQLGAVPRYDEE